MALIASLKTIIEGKRMNRLAVLFLALTACGTGGDNDPDAGGSGPVAPDGGPVAGGALALEFSHEIQGQPMTINNASTLADGSPISFSTFRYWFSIWFWSVMLA